VGAAASFNFPYGIAVRSDGTLLTTGGMTIRQVRSGGIVSTLAGVFDERGSTDGLGAAARFTTPLCLLLRPDGSLLVTESLQHRLRSVSAEGMVGTVAGSAQEEEGSTDGPSAQARFHFPRGLAPGPGGSTFIADGGNFTIRCLSADGGTVSTVAGAAEEVGLDDGPGPDARFLDPKGLAAGPGGVHYVTDFCSIRCISAAGVVSTLAGRMPGYRDGPCSAARFNEPWGLAVGPDGSIYVADTENHLIRRISPEGIVSTLAGKVVGRDSEFADGLGPTAAFLWPRSVAVGPDGSLYVTDAFTVRRIT
jgi:DNA-binding beta-propeller fold protein YncE